MGDYNSDFTKDENSNIPHDFGREMFCFCQEEGLTISDYDRDAHGITSWLNHLVGTTSVHALVDSIGVQYKGKDKGAGL